MSVCVYVLAVVQRPYVGVLQPWVVAQTEELHDLARVVLVGLAAGRVGAVQPQQHRRVVRHLLEQRREVAQRVAAEQAVLAEHVARVAHAGVARREQVVQVERHPLDQLVARPHHPVEPPQTVVAPLVERRDRLIVDLRSRADQHVRPKRRQQLLHRVAEALVDVVIEVRAVAEESGAPQQPLEVRPRLDAGYLGVLQGHRRDLRFCAARVLSARVDPVSGCSRRRPAASTVRGVRFSRSPGPTCRRPRGRRR